MIVVWTLSGRTGGYLPTRFTEGLCRLAKAVITTQRLHFMSDALPKTGPLRHFLQFRDFSAAEIQYVLDRARLTQDKIKRYEPHHTLHDRNLAMAVAKASPSPQAPCPAAMYQLRAPD